MGEAVNGGAVLGPGSWGVWYLREGCRGGTGEEGDCRGGIGEAVNGGAVLGPGGGGAVNGGAVLGEAVNVGRYWGGG